MQMRIKKKSLMNRLLENRNSCRGYPGVVLLVTLVLLVVLSALGYTLSSRVAAYRHRNHYIVDYQAARYACDSAMKYAMVILPDVNNFPLVARPNEPDFSDLFRLSEIEYEELLAQWAVRSEPNGLKDINNVSNANRISDINNIYDFNDINKLDPNYIKPNDVNQPMTVRGPYGPQWPLIMKPTELEIGSAKVKIEIEDENAKYPLGWAMLSDEEVEHEVQAGLGTFCEWMDISKPRLDLLREQLDQITEIRPFKLDFKPIKKRIKVEGPPRKRGRRRVRRTRSKLITIQVHEQIARQTTAFAELFHSSLIDTETLAMPTIDTENRKESALKYMGMWASRKVNVNTAPRHVLEAAFTFGGDAEEIAEEIIRQRRTEPFADIESLKKSLFRYSTSIGKCEKYITTVSSFFTIRIKAVSGTAEASAVVAVTKDGKEIKKIAVISG